MLVIMLRYWHPCTHLGFTHSVGRRSWQSRHSKARRMLKNALYTITEPSDIPSLAFSLLTSLLPPLERVLDLLQEERAELLRVLLLPRVQTQPVREVAGVEAAREGPVQLSEQPLEQGEDLGVQVLEYAGGGGCLFTRVCGMCVACVWQVCGMCVTCEWHVCGMCVACFRSLGSVRTSAALPLFKCFPSKL